MSKSQTRELFLPLAKAISANSATTKSRVGEAMIYVLDELSLQVERVEGKGTAIALSFQLFGEDYTLLPGGSVYISEDPSTIAGLTMDLESGDDLRFFLMDENERFMAIAATFLKWRLSIAKAEHF